MSGLAYARIYCTIDRPRNGIYKWRIRCGLINGASLPKSTKNDWNEILRKKEDIYLRRCFYASELSIIDYSSTSEIESSWV